MVEAFGLRAAEKVAYHPNPLVAPTGHLLFSRKLANAEELVAAFNRGLAKLRKSGRYTLFQAELISGRYEP